MMEISHLKLTNFIFKAISKIHLKQLYFLITIYTHALLPFNERKSDNKIYVPT